MNKILALICLISVLFTSGASATNTLFDQYQHNSTADNNIDYDFVVADDIVYLFTRGRIDGELVHGYTRVEAPYDAEPQYYEYPMPALPNPENINPMSPTEFYYDGETFWTWRRIDDDCKLYTASFEPTGEVEFEIAVEFPLYAEIEDKLGSNKSCYECLIIGDFFIGLARDSEFFHSVIVTYDMEWDEAEVYRFDDEHRPINVLGMMQYTDETLLVASCPLMDDADELVIYEFDPAEGEFNEVLVLPLGGWVHTAVSFVYDRDNDLLYFMMEGVVHRISGLDPDSMEAIYDLGYSYGGCGTTMPSCHAALTSDGHYIVSNGEILLACDISGEE